MKTADYWQQRTEQVEDVLHNKGVEYYHHLEEQYRLAAKKTQQDVSVLYNRLAANNSISLAEAKKMLTSRELKEFRWTVDEYIKYAKENTVNGAWVQQLENASLRYRISRLEAMKIEMQHHAEVLFSSELDGMTKAMMDIYTEGYYRTAHVIQTGFGVGHSFAKLDTRRIEKVIGKPWTADGTNFSERIWGNHRPQLVNELHSGLTQAIIRGDAPDELINTISKKYDVAASKAGNLVMTESAYFGNVSQQDCYAELGVDEQQFCATLDTRTSEVCRSMDMKVIKSVDVKIGVNAPPLHCRCRSVMVPYFEDDELMERAARDADGKSITVPGDMKYDDWYDKFIKGTDADKPKKSKKSTALKDKVDDIKVDLERKQKTVKTKQAEVKNKKAEIKSTEADIQRLEVDRITLTDKEAKFRSLENVDLDSKIATTRAEIDNMQKKVDVLDEQYVRWYERPERGTPEYDAWREWKNGVNFDDMFNELTDKQDLLRGMKNRLTVLDNDKAFIKGIDIDDLRAQIAKVDDDIVNKRSSVAMLTDDVAHLTDDIADARKGMELDYKRAGKEFISEIQTGDFIGGDDLQKLQDEYRDAMKAYAKETDHLKREALYDKYKQANAAYWDLRRRMIPENTEKVKGLLSQVRSIGASDVDALKKVHLGNSRSSMLKSVMDAYAAYPTEWVDASAAMGKLSLKKVKRGYYSHSQGIIAISGNDEPNMLRTAIHELGHRFERAVDDLLDIEATFYTRRTTGEKLQWLGAGYSRSEKSRFDDFLEKYMGKDYGGTAYEIVSMGFELGFTDPLKLIQDTDMAELIFGLLLMK